MKRGYIETRKGLQIHYTTVGTGDSVLLLHQTARSSGSYARLQHVLSPFYRAIAIDMPGFSNSDPLPEPFELPDLVEVVVDVLNGLGIQKVRISGHHTGAVVAAQLAASYPDRVAALVATGLPLYTAEERKNLLYGANKTGEPKIPIIQLKADGSHLFQLFQRACTRVMDTKNADYYWLPLENLTQEDLEWMNDYIIDNLRGRPGAAGVLASVRRHDLESQLPLIKVPTLVVQSTGKYEPVFLQRAEIAAKRIPGAKWASIKDGCIHVIQSRPEELGKMMVEFFTTGGTIARG